MEIETEIKYEVNNLSEIKIPSGFLLGEGREKNSFIDFGNRLSKRGIKVRVREYCTKITITEKKKGTFIGGIKEVPERNIDLAKGSLSEVLDFFKDLGAREIGYYEKENRVTYIDNEDCLYCLDTILDRGKERYFVEIEAAEREVIIEKARKLGLDNPELEARIMEKSYFEMFARKR